MGPGRAFIVQAVPPGDPCMSRRRPLLLRRLPGPMAVSLTALCLLGCGSNPMPKGPVLPPAGVLRPAPSASAPAVAASVPATLPPAANAFETVAVAARFPEPSVAYALPALQPDRQDFTTPAELQARLQALAAPRPSAPAVNPTSITLVPLGNSQDGAPLQAVVFTRHPSPTPAIIVRGGRPTVMLVSQQHGDEPAGTEALLLVAEALASGNLQDLLERINVVILPRANPDGAARGQAALANGTDLDTDHLLLATPEARAMARLVVDYRPLLVVDAHEYPVDAAYAERVGGAQRADIQLQYAGTAGVPEFVSKASEEWFRQPLLAALKQDGLTVEWAHRMEADGQRVSMGNARPDSARNANGLRNAVSVVLESRGANLGRVHLNRRVHSQVSAITALLKSSAQRADDLVKLRKYVDASVRADLCSGTAMIDAQLSTTEHTLVLLDTRTGADKSVAVSWDSSLVLRDAKRRTRPCGYWLGADQSNAVSRLRGLGLRVEQLSEALDGMQADADTGASVAGQRETLEFKAPAGSYYVPLSQPWGNLVVAALEPDSAQGFVANKVVTSANRLRKVTAVPKVRRKIY